MNKLEEETLIKNSREGPHGFSSEKPYVRITNKPVSCCGVIQQGWDGQVAYILETNGMTDDIKGDIVILSDGTLVWSYHCEEIPTPRMN